MTDLWHWPQWTMAILAAVALLCAAALHDKPRTGNHNIITTLLNQGLLIWLLHEGGFW